MYAKVIDNDAVTIYDSTNAGNVGGENYRSGGQRL